MLIRANIQKLRINNLRFYISRWAIIVLLLILAIKGYCQKRYAYPIPVKSNVTDNYFGTQVEDPYRWLENLHSDSTVNWLNEQEKILNQFRKKLSLEDEIYNKLSHYSYINFKPLIKKGKFYFSYQYDDESTVPSLYYRKKSDGNACLIVKPDDFRENKKEILTIDSYEISSDSKYLAVSLSINGADRSIIRVVDMNNGKALPDQIEEVKFASIAWKENGFFYLKFDTEGKQDKITAVNKNPQIFYHKLATSQIDDILIYKNPHNIDSIHTNFFNFDVTSDEKYLIIKSVINLDSKVYKGMLYAALDSFPKIDLNPFLLYPASSNTSYIFIDNIGNQFLVLTDSYASSKKLMLYDPSKGYNHVKEIIKPDKEILEQVTVSKDKIICLYYSNGSYTARITDFNGQTIKSIPFPSGCKVSGFEMCTLKDETFCYVSSFYFPSVVFRLDMNDLSFAPLDITYITFNQLKYETSYVTYMSKDSVEIPMYLTYKKGIKRNGNNPTILYGYGGFGIIMSPFFSPTTIAWLENGGILAVPSIRGGGEEGTNWHKNAVRLKRYNSYNDFIYAAKFLIDSGYTNPNKLAIEGGSNGGLLVGVAMTQNPELFKAAIPQMAVMDMLRYQYFTIGSAWESEYGISSNKKSFENLFKYSPLHNIKQGIKYPATLAITSDNDDRVSPLHSYKFIATLQEKGDNSNPYLLFVNKEAGHNGSDILEKWLRLEALELAFLFDVLNVKAIGMW